MNYIENVKRISKSTVKEYFFDLRMLLRFVKLVKRLVPSNTEFDEISIFDITIEHIKTLTLDDLISFLSFICRNKENDSCARARKIASIKSFYKYLSIEAKLLVYNPAAELKSPKILKNPPSTLDLNESRKLLKSIDGEYRERDYAIFILLLNCGLKLSELVNINYDDIKGDTITISGNKKRVIYLNLACLKAIEDYLKVRPEEYNKNEKALFLSERKQRISVKTVQYLMKKYGNSIGIDTKRCSAQNLRHTAASLMYIYGEDIDFKTLQEILGVKDLVLTGIKIQTIKQQMKKAIHRNPLSEVIMKNI